MHGVNDRADAFFDKAGNWREELAALRAILLDSALTEDFKWRSPVYTFQGGNVAILWGFKGYAALGFFKGVLLKDTKGILVPPGQNSRSVRLVKVTGLAEIAGMKAILKDCIRAAIAVEKAGLKVDFPKNDLEYPVELTARLEQDAELKAAFAALTPGRKRGYVLHFLQPRQSTTRVSRIDRCVPRILEGKGINER